MRTEWRSRRAFLRGVLGLAGAAAVTGVAGCDFGSGDPPVSHEFDELLTGTAELANRYDAVLAAHSDLAPNLEPIRAAHRAHATALAQLMGQQPPAAGAPAEAPPEDRTEAVAALATAEKDGRDKAVAACLAASVRGAALLGTIAAARATHLEMLK